MLLTGIAPINICKQQIPPLTKPVFVADVHLSNDKPETKKAFFRFLKRDAARFNELVILGDLFEFWVGDDHLIEHDNALNALKEYHFSGKQIYVMHGNRDFLLGPAFERATGAVLVADPIITYAGHEKVLLSHGDAWCTKDTDYQQFRQVFRDPDVQMSILKEKLEHRLSLAASLRNQSKDENEKKDYEKLDVVISEIAKPARQNATPTIIHGHTHRPAHHTHVIDDFRFDRWVLPDWDFDNGKSRGGYLSYENGYLHFGPLG